MRERQGGLLEVSVLFVFVLGGGGIRRDMDGPAGGVKRLKTYQPREVSNFVCSTGYWFRRRGLRG